MAIGIRRVVAGRDGGISGISFVILYQIRLCRAQDYGGVTAETGAAFRARYPGAAARVEPGLARFSNGMLLVLALVCILELGPAIATLGWTPIVVGIVLTLAALACGRAFAGWHAPVWPAGAVATAMRNPGLALVVAAANRTPPAVTAAVFGYALGLALVVTAFVALRRRREPGGPPD